MTTSFPILEMGGGRVVRGWGWCSPWDERASPQHGESPSQKHIQCGCPFWCCSFTPQSALSFPWGLRTGMDNPPCVLASCRALCPLCQGLTLYGNNKLIYFLWAGGILLSCVKHTFWAGIAPQRHGEVKPVHLSCRNTEMKVLVRAELILWDTWYIFDGF